MSKPDPVVIVGAARTPMGAFQGELKDFAAAELGAVAIRAAVERAGLKAEDVQEVIMGCVLPAGQGQAPARQAGLGSEAAFADIGGQSDLQAWYYGDTPVILRCNYGILAGSPPSLCPILRQIPLQRCPEPPLGSAFCILPSYFCLLWAGPPAVGPD